MIEDIRKDLISVIVPVYNVERYLRECLDSLLSQTYPNLEIILIDDGSEDSSGAICDEYASNNENIKAIHKANQGLGIARNVGLQKMHGKYVTFVDSDDYVDKAYIEKLYRGVIDNQVDVCKLGFTRFGDGTKPYKSTEYKDIKFEDKEARNKFLPLMLGSSPESSDAIEMCVCGTIYLAEHITNHMVTFPSERNLISEDLIFNIEYMQYACGACLLNDNSYYYRINPKSLSKRYLADRVVKYCSFYRYEVNRLDRKSVV